MLLITYIYDWSKTKDLNLINQTNIYHVISNLRLMLANVTQIKRGTTINAGVSIKSPKEHHVCEKI